MTSIGGHLRELVLTRLRTCNIGWLMIHLGSMETRYLSLSDGESGDWAGCVTGGSGPGDLALSSNQMWQWDMWHPLWAFRFGLPKSISDSLNNHASHLQTMIYLMRMSGSQSSWGTVRSGDRTRRPPVTWNHFKNTPLSGQLSLKLPVLRGRKPLELKYFIEPFSSYCILKFFNQPGKNPKTWYFLV